MTDEKKEEEERGASGVTPGVDDEAVKSELLDRLEQFVAEEAVLRVDVLRLTRKKLKDELLRDAEYFSDWLVNNEPDAKREWQRHQVAVAAMNGLLVAGKQAGSPPIDNQDAAEGIARTSYWIAEAMMKRREQLKEAAAKPTAEG